MKNKKILKDVCALIIDCEHNTASTQETGYPSIRTPNIGRGRLILEGVNLVSEDTYHKWTKRAVPKGGDIVLAREAPLGNVAIIPENLKVCLGQRTVLIRPDKSKIEPNYLLYLLLGDEAQAKFHGYSTGSTVSHLNMKDIRNFELPELPPLLTQQKIASILSAYDDLIENNNRRIAILEKMAQSIYNEWFVRMRFPGYQNAEFADGLPKGWQKKSLNEVANFTMGQSPSSEYYNEKGEGLPFHQGVTNFGSRFPSHQIYCSVDGRIAEKGDILFSVRAPVGRLNIANSKFILGRGLSAIRHKQNFQSFLFYQLQYCFRNEDIIGNGAIFNAVTKNEMEKIEIIVPDNGFDLKFNEIIQPIDEEIEILSGKNINLRKTRDLLLPRLITGKLSADNIESDAEV